MAHSEVWPAMRFFQKATNSRTGVADAGLTDNLIPPDTQGGIERERQNRVVQPDRATMAARGLNDPALGWHSFRRRKNCDPERRFEVPANWPDRTGCKGNAMPGGTAVANNTFPLREDRSAGQRGNARPTTPLGVSRGSNLIFVVELPPAAVNFIQ